MTMSEARFPEIPGLNAVKIALQFVGAAASWLAGMTATRNVNDLTRLDPRALADAGYSRIDWDSENGQLIQRTLVRIHDW